MLEIVTSLNDWCDKRNLTINMQRQGYTTNIQEEIIELHSAKNEEEEIDAVCDIAVLTINAMKTRTKNMLAKSMDFVVFPVSKNSFAYQLDTIIFENFSEASLTEMLLACYSYTKKLNYDFIKAMKETIKEIESRTGKYDEEKKKWVKDTSQEAKAKWYKADYSKCKL